MKVPRTLTFPLAVAVAVALAFLLRPSTEETSVADLARLDGAAKLAETLDWSSGPGEEDLHRGLGLLLEGRASEARPHLEEAASSPEPDVAQRAKWYLAQAALLLEDVEAARPLLDELSRVSPRYARPASEQLLALRGK